MTARQLSAMYRRREANLRESVQRSLKHGHYKVCDQDIWFLAQSRPTKDKLREAWEKHLELQQQKGGGGE